MTADLIPHLPPTGGDPGFRGWPRLRLLLAGSLAAGMLAIFVLLAYQLILARVPQHRAALERMVRAQTGLDVRFSELGVRWGWYGPEAVFTRVALGEPGQWAPLLSASELVVGFDAWRTLRTGQPQAARIGLIAPDIDLARASSAAAARATNPAGAAGKSGSSTLALDRLGLLQNWRGSRIDIEGGTLRLPTPGSDGAVTVQIRHALLRRAEDQWSIFGLLLLPERLGRTARIAMHLQGDVGVPAQLSGSVHVEARRLLAAGCRELLAAAPGLAPFLPRTGSGDFTVDIAFEHARIVKASGSVRAAGIAFDATNAFAANITAARGPSAAFTDVSRRAAAFSGAGSLNLGQVRTQWRLGRPEGNWRLELDSLQLGASDRRATLTLFISGRRLHGRMQEVPLTPLAAIAQWLDPNLRIAVAELDGVAQDLTFEWDGARAAGDRVQLAGRVSGISLRPPSHDYTLGGFDARLTGSESRLQVELSSDEAHLALTQSRHPPLAGLHLRSRLRIGGDERGWRISTEQFVLEHDHARLRLSGDIWSDARSPGPRIAAGGLLSGADIPLVEAMLGASTARAFGAAASQLTAGRIEDAEFQLGGPLSELPFGEGDGFRGSLRLREATVAGGGRWPDAAGVSARVEWHGSRIHAWVEDGRAGNFQLASGQAQWDASGEGPTEMSGRFSGPLEEAIAWLRAHPQLRDYAQSVADLDAAGSAAFDFSVRVPARVQWPSPVQARVAIYLDDARAQVFAGWPPLQSLSGSITFALGHVQRSRLIGRWLGGPVALQLTERRERGTRQLAISAQGTLDAGQLAGLANDVAAVQGSTAWTAELSYSPGSGVPHWSGSLDSTLEGVTSSLPEPFAKRGPTAVPLHLEATGNAQGTRVGISLADRAQSTFIVQRRDSGWILERGTVQLGGGAAVLPADAVLQLQGHLSRVDLAAGLAAWRQLNSDLLPAVHAHLVADELILAGRSFDQVRFQAMSGNSETELQLDAAAMQGSIRWASPGDRAPKGQRIAEVQLARLDVPERGPPPPAEPATDMDWLGALAPEARVTVGEFRWGGRLLGRLAATLTVHDGLASLENLRLVNSTDEAHGLARCAPAAGCRIQFQLDSSDGAATLQRFGFRPELSAARAAVAGQLQWRPGPRQSWLGSLTGSLSVRLADGAVQPQAATGPDAAADQNDAHMSPFALIPVAALVGGSDLAAQAPPAVRDGALRFSRVAADFELRDGQAQTSDLHFDGDAEILIRGRTGLISRDYDQQIWVLRGEDRLPAAVRRFASPPMAAAWLSLRGMLGSVAATDQSRVALRLLGSWDDPVLQAAN